METAQESELQQRQASCWPVDTMACSLGISNSCLLFEWDPQLRYFGLGVVGVAATGDPGDHTHGHELDLFSPNCMEEWPASEASAAVTGLPTVQDAAVMAEDQLDDLLQSFLDTDDEQLVNSNSSCILKKSTTTTTFPDDDLLALSSVSPARPTSPEETVARPQPEQPPCSSSSSHCNDDPHASDSGEASGGAQRRATRTNCPAKRPVTPEDTDAWRSNKRRRGACSGAGSSPVVYPFTVVKPGGVDGGATLADINERILTPPARPVRHPVGEFACAPRASAGDRRAPSGKAVAGFTRLHTAGRGTITIIRTTS